jgi:hypothetical protein
VGAGDVDDSISARTKKPAQAGFFMRAAERFLLRNIGFAAISRADSSFNL